MEVDFEEGLAEGEDQLTYIIPIICEDDTCIIDFQGIVVEGGELAEEQDVHLVPGDILKFVLGDVEVDLNEVPTDEASSDEIRKRAGEFAIVIVVDENLVAKNASCVRVKKDKPGIIQINPELKSLEGGFQLLELVLYCDSCGCSRSSSSDSGFEKPEFIRFHVGPRPRQRLTASALDATKVKKPTPDPPEPDGEKKGDDD